ncbi:hypothetical protein [Chondromyces crocatus]|uniref:Uncharacterized protein n=1 Tax=Chondromyces crocatus TaxID=52 RepID=A0A0K1EJ67_CHOCO|nr:hypothetical protein [Chondromyces crocatus]AKT40909.1 uncharacterized protein CMC5_050660 [Chondromyces crocatus]
MDAGKDDRVDASERLRIAGEAAVLIEEMGIGLTAVARLRDGVVVLECWGAAKRKPTAVRHVVGDNAVSARALAEICAAGLRDVATGKNLS